MKKLLFVTVLAVLITVGLFAQISQKVYSIDNEIFKAISQVYLASGHAMPSSTGPWSGAELQGMLERLDVDTIPQYVKQLYTWAKQQLEQDFPIQMDKASMKLTNSVAIEFYAHTNTDGPERIDVNRKYLTYPGYDVPEKTFVGRGNWVADLTKTDPFYKLNLEFTFSDAIYFDLEASLQNGFYHGTGRQLHAGYQSEIGCTNLATNIVGFQNFRSTDTTSIDSNFPYRAFIAFGSDNWSVQFGRDRLNWGLGKTGNVVISDNLPFHDMLRFTGFSNSFKYTFLVSFFPHKSMFYDPTYIGSRADDIDPIKGINLYLAHRFEGRFLKDTLGVTITEAIMYASESGTMDFRMLNPITILHNGYIAANSNSTMAIEVDYTPIKGLNLYAQAIVDEFQLPSETSGNPNCMGFLAGAKYMTKIGEGILTTNLEGAYVNPYTYLRYNMDQSHPESELYGLDYIVSNRLYVTGGTDCVIYEENVLGYKYGPDCIVSNLDIEWTGTNKLTLGGNVFFMAHGTHDKWTKWMQVTSETVQNTPTTSHQSGNYRYDDIASRDSICFTLDLGTSASYSFTDRLTGHCRADFISIWNVYNRSGLNATDFQLVTGMKYTI